MNNKSIKINNYYHYINIDQANSVDSSNIIKPYIWRMISHQMYFQDSTPQPHCWQDLTPQNWLMVVETILELNLPARLCIKLQQNIL